MQSPSPYPCPCCGYLVLPEPPGSYEICPICYWEDDIAQLRFVTMAGANRVNLVQAQHHFRELGASESRFTTHVRPARSDEMREPLWRPFSLSLDLPEVHVSGLEYGSTYPDDPTTL